VNTTINDLLSPDLLRSSMEHFWNEQLTIEQTGNGLAAALPLMYPDGWQITVNIEIHDRVKDYMERWAWRWTDLKKQNHELLSAMVYNPDLQDWDNTSLKIGQEVCDLFCPCYDRDQIKDTLIRLKAA
jgi:hypothetical protein